MDEPTESDWEELDAAVQQSSANAAPLTQTQTQTQTQGRAPQQVQTETQAVSERFFVGSPPISPISHHISSRRNLTSTQAEEPSAAGGMHYTIEVPMINDGTGRGVIGHSEGADLFRLLTAGGDFIPPRQPPEQQTERATERAGSERTGTESGGGEPASMPIDMPPPVARGTPSPDAMQVDSLGPMTPRNDDGPFIFDGRGSVDIGTRERENWRSA